MKIALVGFRATGKSTIGKILSAKLGFRFVDLDTLIQKSIKMSITKFFEIHSESKFRSIESQFLQKFSRFNNIVLSCGGGVVLRKKNLQILKKNFLVFYLYAKPYVILKRILSDKKSASLRPPLTNKCLKNEILKLYNLRKPLYEKIANFKVNTSNSSINYVSKLILNYIKNYQGNL